MILCYRVHAIRFSSFYHLRLLCRKQDIIPGLETVSSILPSEARYYRKTRNFSTFTLTSSSVSEPTLVTSRSILGLSSLHTKSFSISSVACFNFSMAAICKVRPTLILATTISVISIPYSPPQKFNNTLNCPPNASTSSAASTRNVPPRGGPPYTKTAVAPASILSVHSPLTEWTRLQPFS